MVEWDAYFAKSIPHRGQDILPALRDLLEAYYCIFPNKVMTFAQVKVDEPFEPDGFREEMEKYIYRTFSETKVSTPLLANTIQDVEEKLLNFNGINPQEEFAPEDQ